METRDVVHAPPRHVMLRRLALLGVLGVALIALAQFALFPWLRRHLGSAPPELAFERLTDVFLVIAALLVVSAAWTTWEGVRTLRARQWPMPGSFVLRDTPVRRGRWVKVRASILIGFGVLQLALAGYAAVLPRLVFAPE